jgi:hypothetical protein
MLGSVFISRCGGNVQIHGHRNAAPSTGPGSDHSRRLDHPQSRRKFVVDQARSVGGDFADETVMGTWTVDSDPARVLLDALMHFGLEATRNLIPDIFQCLLQLCHLVLLKERNKFVY